MLDAEGREAERPIRQTALSGALIGKGNHRHFMEKEIFEQPAVLGDTLRSFADPATHRIALPELPFDLARGPRVPSSPAAPRPTPAWSASTGSRAWPGCRSTGTSPASSATARRRWRRAGRAVRLPVGRDRRHAGGDAPPAPRASRRWRWSTCPRARWRARPTACCAPWPAPRSASPRPRRSPPSSPRWPAWPSARRQARGRLDARARGRADQGARRAAGAHAAGAREGPGDPRHRRKSSRRRATCSTSAAAPATPWRSRGR